MLKAVVSEDTLSVHEMINQVIDTLLAISPTAKWKVAKLKVCIYLLTHVIMCLCKYFTTALDLRYFTPDQISQMVNVLVALFDHYRHCPDSSRELYLEIIWSLCVLIDAEHYSPSNQFIESVHQELAASFFKDSYVQCLNSEQRWHANLVTALFLSICRTVCPQCVQSVYTPLLKDNFQRSYLSLLTPQPTLSVDVFKLIQRRYNLEVRYVLQIQQLGAFTTCRVEKNRLLGFVTGIRIDRAQKEKLYLNKESTHLYGVSKDLFLDTINETSNPLTYLNHSNTPNCDFKVSGRQVRIWSIQKIAKGEQLTINYRQQFKGKKMFSPMCSALTAHRSVKANTEVTEYNSPTNGYYSIVNT
jgi:hypothetical protein